LKLSQCVIGNLCKYCSLNCDLD